MVSRTWEGAARFLEWSALRSQRWLQEWLQALFSSHLGECSQRWADMSYGTWLWGTGFKGLLSWSHRAAFRVVLYHLHAPGLRFPAWFTSRCSLTQLLRSEQSACSCRRCANPLLGTEWIFVMIIKEFKDAWKEDCERMWYGIMIVKRFISLLLASSSTKPYVKCSTWTSNSSWSSELPCLRICCKKCFL